MRRNIVIAKKAISADLCNLIVETGKKITFERAQTGNGEDPVNRKSSISWLNGSMRYLEIYQPIQSLINEVNSKFYYFDLTELEPFQITKYHEKNQGYYKPHIDGLYDNVPKGNYVRKLSLSIQLSNPENYEGGTFEFPDDEEKFILDDSMEQGTAIFFPSYMEHGVKPVTKGTRYSLVVWTGGPSFI
tara:strand:- start:473 stop:1036 length:564 start_codon:yes stop_codon:yes gene_type:complete